MKVEAGKEHRWLLELVGEWDSEGEAEMEPGQPVPEVSGAPS